MINNIATVGVYVEDQKAALAFWQKLGFEVRREQDMGNGYRWLEVAPPGAQSRLVIYPRAIMKNWQELKPSIVFECEDIEAFIEKLKAENVTIKDDLKQMPWGKFAIIEDQDGNDFILKG